MFHGWNKIKGSCIKEVIALKKLALYREEKITTNFQLKEQTHSKSCISFLSVFISHLSRSSLENWISSIWCRAALSCWGLTGMVKCINELYCILSSPTSFGMHVCMLNIWICIGIEHLLSELAVSWCCALNNNPAEKWTAFSLPLPCNWKKIIGGTFCFLISSRNRFWMSNCSLMEGTEFPMWWCLLIW